MKTYTNIKNGLLAIGVMILLSAVQVSAYYEPHDLSGLNPVIKTENKMTDSSSLGKGNPADFNRGRAAGIEAGKESINSCAVGGNELDKGGDHARVGLNDDSSSRLFVAGFNSGFGDSANLYNYSYCKR